MTRGIVKCALVAALCSLPGIVGAEPAADVDYIRFQPGRTGRVHAQATGTQAYALLKIGFFQAVCVTALTPSRGFQHEAEVEGGKLYCLRLSAAASMPYRLIITPAL